MKSKKTDRVFFLAIALWIFVICFLGFSKSFYFRSSERPPLASYTATHGIITSLWMTIFLVQSVLLNTKKYKQLHFKLGWAGLITLMAFFISGLTVAFLSGQARGKPADHTGDAVMHFLLALILGLIAISYRKKPWIHKRLMVLSSMVMSSAGVARLDIFDYYLEGPAYYVVMFMPLLAIWLYDILAYRKVFRVTIISTAFICLSIFYSYPIWESQLWATILHYIVSSN